MNWKLYLFDDLSCGCIIWVASGRSGQYRLISLPTRGDHLQSASSYLFALSSTHARLCSILPPSPSPPSRKYEGHQHQIETHFVEYSIFPLLPWMALTSPCEWASNEDSPFESNDVNPSPSLPGMVHKSFPPLRPLTATVAQEKKEKTALSSHYLQIGWVLQMVRRAGESSKKCGETFIFFPFVRNSKSVKILLSAHPSVNIHMFACSGSAWKSTTGWIVEQTLPLANIFWQHLTQRSIKGR